MTDRFALESYRDFATGLIWGLIVFLSFTGTGCFASFAFGLVTPSNRQIKSPFTHKPRAPSLDSYVKPLIRWTFLGFCLQMAAGGVLNLFNQISSLTLNVLVLLPIAFLIFQKIVTPFGLNLHAAHRSTSARSTSARSTSARSTSARSTSARLTSECPLPRAHAWVLAWLRSKANLFAYLPLLLVFLVHYAGLAALRTFMIHDDLHAYLVFPLRALQTGTLNGDPFNLRRLESSLGAMSFLDTEFIVHAKYAYLNLVDAGLGKLLLILGGTYVALDLRLSPVKRYAFIFMCLVSGSPLVNLTSVVTGEALLLYLFYSLFKVTGDPGPIPKKTVLEWGLILGTLIALKSTFLVAGVLILFFTLIFAGFWDKDPGPIKRTLNRAGLSIACSLAVLVAWMCALYASDGTFFYPLLGRGYHASHSTLWPSLLSGLSGKKIFYELLQILFYPEHLLILILTFIGYRNFPLKKSRVYLLGSLGVILGSTLVLGLATGFTSVHRYGFPVFYAYALILFAQVLAQTHSLRSLLMLFLLGALLILAEGRSLFFNLSEEYSSLKAWDFSSHTLFLRAGEAQSPPPLNLTLELSRITMLQARIPIHEKLLAHLSTPFLLDFKRNEIFVADFPGAVSPGPGLRLNLIPEANAHYFRDQGIFYIAYSYHHHANLTEGLISSLNGKHSLWPFLQFKSAAAGQALFLNLSLTYPKIYDDGESFVLDLHPLSPLKPSSP